ncbi:envelope glycoprotein C [Canid alphaherpesvirus 1]|uniref:Glycoprotein C n=1 Tax=Canid alphaherpesvirus 1 TaxID=170325 RepID=Q91SC9_9ALPH|nr:envelope glycoprotein C [Canid alphaherpesvirus 1]AAK51053.1 glycoprotein C [Canid alphaherpesvirus 1]ALL25892.1 envelope glycoprotein C [Canid alphaherpesvirus 1]ALL25972.1 envelope glycoprotein C [Canid alphaherpesvirus 1]ALL26048.1 envelope glycoprotein C [Canid alphaherpesvirus 1]ARE29820.1 envelope glycoprotein C [Canid alphaherpesvirus 1]
MSFKNFYLIYVIIIFINSIITSASTSKPSTPTIIPTSANESPASIDTTITKPISTEANNLKSVSTSIKPPKNLKKKLLKSKCRDNVIYRPYFSQLEINCTITKKQNLSNPLIELWFKELSTYNKTNENVESLKTDISKNILLFSTKNNSDNFYNDFLLGIQNQPVNYKLYGSQFYDNGNILLNIKSVDFKTSGIYTWKVYNSNNESIFETFKIQVYAYHSPNVNLKSNPSLYNENYSAICTIANYFPLESTEIFWFNDGQPIDKKYIDETYSVWIDGLITRTSILSLPFSEAMESPPNLRCNVEWYKNSKASKKFSNTVIPKVYYKPFISIKFDNGLAICDAKCVSRENNKLQWLVKDIPINGDDIISGPCLNHPGLVNIQNKIDISDYDEPVTYKCSIIGYPIIFPNFYDEKVFDASDENVSKSMLISITTIIGGAIFVIVLIFITALCFYCSKNNKI